MFQASVSRTNTIWSHSPQLEQLYLYHFISTHRLVVGAPVADSNFSRVKKPGAIFKCSVSNKGSCQEMPLGWYFFPSCFII